MKRRHKVVVTSTNRTFARKFWTGKRASTFLNMWLVWSAPEFQIKTRYEYTFRQGHRQ